MRLPLPALLQDPSQRSTLGWTVIRVALAGLIGAHGWARLIADAVVPFGHGIDAWGFPFGLGIASTITALEIVGSIALALGRFVVPLTLVYAFNFAMGIVLVHAPEGWFVVGLGRNGSEFSVLLIICLLCVGLQHVKARAPASVAAG